MKPKTPPPSLAIVGRTNVGKSTLFNRLVEEKKALVSDIPGTTRDRNFGGVVWRGAMFVAVDTAGLDVPEVELREKVLAQIRIAQDEAAVIAFLVDVTSQSPTVEDRALAKVLRVGKKPVLLIANKCDGPARKELARAGAWQQLGFGPPIVISAANGTGVGDMLDAVYAQFKKAKKKLPEAIEEPATRVTFIGQPNVGKSSLVNALLGEDRVVVADFPGTTREPQDTFVLHDKYPFLLIDTVGIRRKARYSLESEGVARTLEAVRLSDVVMLVLDADRSPSTQDRRLAGEVAKSHKGAVIVVNKWDLVPEKTTKTQHEYIEMVHTAFPFLHFAPVLFVSAKTTERVNEVFEVSREIVIERKREIPESELEDFIRTVQSARMKGMGVAHPKTYRFSQVATEPPTFLLVAKGATPIPDAYTNFLEKRLRERFGFEGTPIRMQTKTIKS